MRYLAVSKLTLLLFLVINGCGSSSLQNAKTTVATVGLAWMQIDSEFAPAYEQARIEARETSQTWEERDEKLADWEAARTSITSAGMALKSAALAISISEQQSIGNWKELTKEALLAVEAALAALQQLDLKIPPGIKKALDTGKLLLEGA